MTSRMLDSAPSRAPVTSPAVFNRWLAEAEPGEQLEYYRGLLVLDRVKGSSSLKEAERRKLVAVADRAFRLAERGKLHLLQERHGNGDYSYLAVARGSVRSSGQVRRHLSGDQHCERPRP